MAARRLAVGAWLAALALCAIVIAQARFVADLSSFLPTSPTPEQRFLVDQLRDGAVGRLVLVGIDGADAHARAAVSRGLAARLRGDPLFTSVANGSAAGWERERGFLFDHRYLLSPNVSGERFTVQGLHTTIAATIEELASPAGLLLKSLLARDPTGETLAIAERLEPTASPRLAEGVWASPAAERALLLVQTRAGASDVNGQARAAARLEEAFAAARTQAGASASATRLVMTGPGVFSARSRALIEHEVLRLTTLSALLVVALLLVVYRSVAALGLGLVPVLTGAAAGIATVALGFGVVHGITLGFGTTLIGEAVDYSIYLFVQSERAEQAGDRAWLAGFWPTIRLGVLTSIAGFCALLFSGLPGLEQLGLYSIAGLAAAAAVTRFVLPALLPARFHIRDVSGAGRRIAAVANQAPRLRIAIAALALAAASLLALHAAEVWDPRLESLNPITANDRALDAELRAQLGAADARYLIAIPAADAEGALERAEAIGARLDALATDARIGGYESAARILPSARTQRSRIASLPDADALRARLREALRGLPIQPARLEPFVEDVERARTATPLGRAELSGTVLAAALEGLLFADPAGRWTAVIALRPAPGAAGIDAQAVRDALNDAAIPGALFLDLKREIERLYAGYLQRAVWASAIGLLVIVALLLAALRSASRMLRVMAPLVAALLVVAAAHILCGTRLTLLHLVGLLLVVAIGSNYALFFDRLASAAGNAPRTLVSLALANATTVASFGVLATSAIPVLQSIGSVVAPGALLALAFSAAFARGGVARC